MNRHLPLAVLLASATLPGCTTHLTSVKTDSSVASRRGAPYMLQFTQYKVVLTRRVVDCGSDFKSVNKAEITSTLVDDGAHAYVIPSESLRHPFKMSDLTVEWNNGRLVAVNAAAEDRSAQTILAAVQGFGKVVTTVATGGVVGANGSTEGCTDELIANLVAEKQAKSDVGEEKTAIDRAKSEVTRLAAVYAASGNDPAQRPALTRAVNDLDAAMLRLQDAEDRLKTALAFLTYETTVIWPETSSTFATDKPFEAPSSIFPKWYDVPQRTAETAEAWETRRTQRYKELAEPMKVWLAIARDGSYGRDPLDTSPTDEGTAADGIRFRLPANGRLLVCEKAACKRDAGDTIVTQFPGPVAQLGHIYYASFSSPPFTSGTFALTLDDQGRPKKMGVARKTSAAETVAGLGRDVAGELVPVYAALNRTPVERAAEELAALESEKKLADARAALDPSSPAKQLAALDMQKKLADARAALEQPPTYELARLTAIAEAQRKYEDSVRALRPDTNAEHKVQKDAIDAERAVLQAEASRIEAQILLKDARARLGQ